MPFEEGTFSRVAEENRMNFKLPVVSTGISYGGYFWIDKYTRLPYNAFCKHEIQKGQVILGIFFSHFINQAIHRRKTLLKYKTFFLLSKVIRISF